MECNSERYLIPVCSDAYPPAGSCISKLCHQGISPGLYSVSDHHHYPLEDTRDNARDRRAWGSGERGVGFAFGCVSGCGAQGGEGVVEVVEAGGGEGVGESGETVPRVGGWSQTSGRGRAHPPRLSAPQEGDDESVLFDIAAILPNSPRSQTSTCTSPSSAPCTSLLSLKSPTTIAIATCITGSSPTFPPSTGNHH